MSGTTTDTTGAPDEVFRRGVELFLSQDMAAFADLFTEGTS